MSGVKEDCYWFDYWQDMNASIPFCKLQKVDEFLETCDGCEKYHSKYTKTYSDKIRSMSDEKLAEWFCTTGACPENAPDVCYQSHDQCSMCWLNYLKQEAME